MNEFGKVHIKRIQFDVRQKKINFSHLCEELVDHICCDVEQEMEYGLSFEEAYNKVKAHIGFRGLNKIQEETLYAVDTKYRRMKNTMKITGIAGTVLLSSAAMFKIIHWPLAGMMLVIGAFILVTLFVPSSLFVLWKESRSGRYLFLFATAFLAGALFIAGALFKTQHWPGTNILIYLAILSAAVLFLPTLLVMKLKEALQDRKKSVYYVAFITALFYLAFIFSRFMQWPYAGYLFMASAILFIILLPWYVIIEWKEEPAVKGRFVFIIIALVSFIVSTALISLNIEKDYNAGFSGMVQNTESTVDAAKADNEAYISVYADSQVGNRLGELHQKTRQLLHAIDSIKSSPTLDEEINKGSSRKEIDKLVSGYVNEFTIDSSVNYPVSILHLPVITAMLPNGDGKKDDFTIMTGKQALNLIEMAVLLTESDIFRQIAGNSEPDKTNQ